MKKLILIAVLFSAIVLAKEEGPKFSGEISKPEGNFKLEKFESWKFEFQRGTSTKMTLEEIIETKNSPLDGMRLYFFMPGDWRITDDKPLNIPLCESNREPIVTKRPDGMWEITFKPIVSNPQSVIVGVEGCDHNGVWWSSTPPPPCLGYVKGVDGLYRRPALLGKPKDTADPCIQLHGIDPVK